MSQSDVFISKKYKIQTVLWLILAVSMTVLWLFLWIGSDSSKKQEKHQENKSIAQERALPVYIEKYVQMTKEVPPIDFSMVVRDLRNYPKEFKDKKYFEKDAKRWTVQVMNVSQNEIITAYLDGRADRDKFAYFRYHTTNNELRYILTYGVMANTQEALATIKAVDFGLPDKIKLRPEEIKHYLNIMDSYERAEVGNNTGAEVRPVILRPATNIIPAQPLRASTDRFPRMGTGQGGDNKFQNALPNVMNNQAVPHSSASNASNSPVVPNVPSAQKAPQQKYTATNKQVAQIDSEEVHQEISLEVPKPSRANIQRATPQEVPVSYGQSQDEVKYDAPRPNTNTTSVPGAGD